MVLLNLSTDVGIHACVRRWPADNVHTCHPHDAKFTELNLSSHGIKCSLSSFLTRRSKVATRTELMLPSSQVKVVIHTELKLPRHT